METLNGLQTNAAVLEKVSKSATGQRRSRELHEVVTFLKRIGLDTSNLDQLNAIHVTGTKGKVEFSKNYVLYMVYIAHQYYYFQCY